MLRKLAALAFAGAAFVGGCGDDGDGSAAGDVERYCALVAELDEAGSEAFAALEEDETATDEDFAEAERQFVQEHREDFEELRRVAPKEVADDVDVLIAAQEARASGGEQEETSGDVAIAEERVSEFEVENC